MFCDQFVGDRLSLDVRQSGEGIHHTTSREFCNMKNATTSARSVTQNMTSTVFLSPWSNSVRGFGSTNSQHTLWHLKARKHIRPTDRPTLPFHMKAVIINEEREKEAEQLVMH